MASPSSNSFRITWEACCRPTSISSSPVVGSDGLIEHDGEEMGYLLCRHIDLEVDGAVYRLGPGDSFCFRSERPHGYRNPGATQALILWVNTPPTF
jgi:hypothetical protein